MYSICLGIYLFIFSSNKFPALCFVGVPYIRILGGGALAPVSIGYGRAAPRYGEAQLRSPAMTRQCHLGTQCQHQLAGTPQTRGKLIMCKI